ncbi:MAG TPA: cytochrome c biogenesis protein CcdA [Candidatus Cloacimonadota bacterium]|nr:cytochrome c biogenesis protein CcdA [Candidatus Cloacimonadota bacterium]
MQKKRLLFAAVILLFLSTLLMGQSVKFAISPAKLEPGDKGVITATLSIPDGKHQSHDPSDPAYFYLEASHPSLSFGKVIYPKGYKVVSATQWDYHKSVKLTLPFTVKKDAPAGKVNIEATLAYNLCFDDGMCEPPDEAVGKVALEILAAANTEPGTEKPIAAAGAEAEETEAVEQAEQSEAEALPSEGDQPKEKEESSMGTILKYMLFALLGGLILNITPCVLPILPIRVMAIVNQAHQDRGKVLLHTLVYSLGVLLSFAILAGIFIGLRSAGETQGWGFQNQNPMFNVILLSVVFAFALSLLGVFVLTVPGMNTASKATSKGGYSGSFFGGIFAFVMAISCTGPFLGAALPFAFKLSSPLLMLFFLLIGLGFALPFILIGIFPGALKIIPKPGEWMNIFKEVMGFVLLYLVYTMLKTTLALTSGAYLLNVVFYLIVLGFALWMYGRFVRAENSTATQWVFSILALVVIVAGGLMFLPIKAEHLQAEVVMQADASGMIPAPHAPEGWYVFSPEVHEKLMSENKPVFLDIGADWCKNCMTNEKTVLFTDNMMQEFKAAGVTLLRGDFTRSDPVLLKWIQDHDRMGVPFNALYIPGKEPILFPELISHKMVKEALDQIPKGE